ncbi:Peroxisome assembly protein 12 [Eufriesea mexicana]|uniref:Peroxisome assembly protein 12 n=1 Tax=Eufriesea mexicana TaxID=516756 RepID=A0A310S559_9HYME|nr:PREDICTED: peroxisome assembly protein 12 [Eufriesea mexicana]OAD52507.1 Peroxisome assembly protein 12 [Eufriesea mexicana]
MAEKGAHLTGTTFIKPSIFEVIAQESFASTVEPAFKKLLSFIASFNIERYGHLLRWTDEGYLIFNTFLQCHYFNKYSASFSEAFYGLKRITIIDSKVKCSLSNKQRNLSLMLSLLFPYIKSKLSQLSQKYEFEDIDGCIPQSKWQQLYHNCIIKGNMIIFTIYEFMVLYNYILYISGKSAYTSPLLRLLSITLTYTEPEPIISISSLLKKIKVNSFGVSDGIDIFQRMVTASLEFAAFFLQFLSWWTQEHYLVNLLSLPIPPPPKIPEIAKQYKGICPICHKALRIHTVLSVSGYVFCYQCILPVIRTNRKCPVTKYPAKEDDLIRLYLD